MSSNVDGFADTNSDLSCGREGMRVDACKSAVFVVLPIIKRHLSPVPLDGVKSNHSTSLTHRNPKWDCPLSKAVPCRAVGR